MLKDVTMEYFLYGMLVLTGIAVFCAVVLTFLMFLTAAFLNDPEFDYADDMREGHTWNRS